MPVETRGLDDAEKFLKRLGGTTRGVLSDSLNDLVKQSKANAVDSITGALNLTTSSVSSKLQVEASTAKSLTAKLSTESKGLSLAHYGAEQLWKTKKGKRYRKWVSVRVKKRRATLKKAFLFKGKQGKTLVGVRTGKKRNDIKALYGPSVSQAFDTFKDPLAKTIEDNFEQTFLSAFDKTLK